MEVIAYNSEKFERSRWRYIAFSAVFAIIFFLSIFNDNIVGAVLLFFLLGGYFYYSVSNNQTIKISVEKGGLTVGTRVYPWTNFVGYALEVDSHTQIIKNIVFIGKKNSSIHTLHDSAANIKNFIIVLNDYLPMLSEYEQTAMEKLARRLKL